MEPSSLKTLFWNVTYACNYQCGICFTNSSRHNPKELNTKESLIAVEKAHAAGVKDIIISGGEPFMREDLVEILAHMAKLGITARIASNGSLITKEMLTRLRQETLTKSFQISLDTTDPDLYAKFHGVKPEMYPSILTHLHQIKDQGFHTTVSVRLTPQTFPGLSKLLDLVYKEEWFTLTVHSVVHTNRIEGAYPQDEDLYTLLEPIFQHFCSLPQHWLIETYIPWATYHPVIIKLAKKVKVVNRGCRAGRDRLTINPTGMISPCVCMDVPEAYIGNIRNDDLLDVFNNSQTCDIFRNPQNYGICADCPNVVSCGGGCRAAGFAMSGQLKGQDKSCPIWKKRGKLENK